MTTPIDDERFQRQILDARFVEPDIHAEIRHIKMMAQTGEARIVTLINLVFFSTDSRDAWVLDPEDNFALCLMREGREQDYRILETAKRFVIEWNADFEIEGDVLTVYERSGGVTSIVGGPVEQVAAACERRIV